MRPLRLQETFHVFFDKSLPEPHSCIVSGFFPDSFVHALCGRGGNLITGTLNGGGRLCVLLAFSSEFCCAHYGCIQALSYCHC